MGSRLDLHSELLEFLSKVYFQPPADMQIEYPCIIYNKSDILDSYGNDDVYINHQQYKLIVIDRDPDSNIADRINKWFQYCTITSYYSMDNLNHTTLTLYY